MEDSENKELIKQVCKEINNIKERLILDIEDIFENPTIKNLKLINDLQNKMEREKDVHISKIESLDDYDKIILKDLESRISILEEESQKYNIS